MSCQFGAVLPRTTDAQLIRCLVRHGAGVNGQCKSVFGSSETVITNLCSVCYRDDCLPSVVWLLQHEADPNVGVNEHEKGLLAIHYALFAHRLPYVIALLQGGVHLNSKTLDHEQPLACAYRLWQMRHYAPTVEVDPTPLAHAQYELLKAVSERKLDPHYVYEIGAYEAMGISHRSAKLIQKATQEVNEVFVQCVLDDWKFEHPGQNITEFLLNRELGAAGRGRR